MYYRGRFTVYIESLLEYVLTSLYLIDALCYCFLHLAMQK